MRIFYSAIPLLIDRTIFFFSKRIFDVLERNECELVVSTLLQQKACKLKIPVLFQKDLCADDTDFFPERLGERR